MRTPCAPAQGSRGGPQGLTPCGVALQFMPGVYHRTLRLSKNVAALQKRLSETLKMFKRLRCNAAAAGGAFEKAELDEIGLMHFLDSCLTYPHQNLLFYVNSVY